MGKIWMNMQNMQHVSERKNIIINSMQENKSKKNEGIRGESLCYESINHTSIKK